MVSDNMPYVNDQENIPGYKEYELDVEQILRNELPGFFEGIPPAGLTMKNIVAIPRHAKGAYLLLHNGSPVYAGKTDTRHGFRDRLKRHHGTLAHRVGLDPGDVSFKAARVMVFSNFDVEAILINEMRKRLPGSLPWNDSGFGSNDPGHRREGQEPAKFDLEWPVDVERHLDWIKPGSHNLSDLLAHLKNGLPYLLRYQPQLVNRKSKKGASPASDPFREARETMVCLSDAPISTKSVLKAVIDALPANQWQATIFPNRAILYRAIENYRYATDIIRKN